MSIKKDDDLTDEKKTADHRFIRFIKQSPISTAFFAPDGSTFMVNQAFIDLWQVPQEGIEHLVQQFNVFEDNEIKQSGLWPYIQDAFAGNPVKYPPIAYDPAQSDVGQPAGGTKRWIQGTAYPIKNSDGTLHGVILTHEDITLQKEAEFKLQQSELRFRNWLEQSPLSTVIYQPNGRIIMANPAAAKFWHASPEIFAYILENYNILEDDQLVTNGLMPYIQQGFAGKSTALPDIEYDLEDAIIAQPAGSPPKRWVRGFIYPILNKDNSVSEVVVIHEDVTEQRLAQQERERLQERMLHSQKLESLGVLAGGIAHDFNNILTGILGNAGLASRKLDRDPISVGTNIERIETAALRAAELCNQLLAYSGKGQFQIQAINLNDVVREMVYLLEVAISRNVSLKYDLSSELPAVEADATQIRQIIMNLITNASEAIGQGNGMITISTGSMECDAAYLKESYLDDNLQPGFYVFLEVLDTGHGMDAATIKRIFDPFFTTKFTGRGLGLAAVLGIIRSHRGALKVYSELNQGTSIKILLPYSPQTAQPSKQRARFDASWQGEGTVLVADDEEAVRLVAKQLFSEAGFHVITAENGRLALSLFQQHQQDVVLVLLDMTMPEMGGNETFRELRRIQKNVKVILSSGYNEQEAVNRFIGKGLAGFIQKPYQPNALLALAKEILST